MLYVVKLLVEEATTLALVLPAKLHDGRGVSVGQCLSVLAFEKVNNF